MANNSIDPTEEGRLQRSGGRPNSARLRAQPIREEQVRDEPLERGERLTRRRKRTEDRLYVDPAIIPDGVSYEWKAKTIFGAENKQYMAALMENHWRPVPPDRHPGLVTEIYGSILMERPAYLTMDARQEDFDVAMNEVIGVSQGLRDTPSGTMTRNHPSAQRATRVNREFSTSLRTDSTGQLIVPER